MCLFKKALLGHLLGTVMGAFTWDESIKDNIREAFRSTQDFRKKCGYPNGPPAVSLAWRAGWPKSADAFLSFVESCFFSYHFDAAIRTALINRKDVASAVTAAPLSDELEEIKGMMVESEAPTGDGAGDGDLIMDDDAEGEGGATNPALENSAEIKKLTKAFADMTHSKDKLEGFLTQAKRFIATHVSLGVETDTDDQIIKAMQESAAAKCMKDGFTGIFYDSKVAGEASTHPSVRLPPLRDGGEHLKRLVALRLRAGAGEIAEKEVFFIYDAGKDGNKSCFVGAFPGLQKEVRHINVVYDQDSLEARLDKVRGYLPVNQLERIYMITRGIIKMPDRKSLHFSGTNRGNSIGPVAMPSYDEQEAVWRAPMKQKKDIIGKIAKIPVGGTLPEVPAAELAKLSQERAINTSEPVFYHAPPLVLDEELVHRYNLQSVFSLTAGQGDLAMTMLRNRRPYFGICLSQPHKDALFARLEQQVWAAYQKEGDKLYEPNLVELIKSSNTNDDEGETPNPKKQPKRPRKPKDPANPEEETEPKRPKSDPKLSKAELLKKIASLTGSKVGEEGEGENGEGNDEASEPDSQGK